MHLSPLLGASLAIRLHAFAALGAFGLGALQLWLPKGTPRHRLLGWIWVALMAGIALSSFAIHTICTFGPFSIIHLLSAVTLVALPVGVLHTRRHRVARHRRVMQLLFFGALIVAGIFTLTPGRIMHDVVFGTAGIHGSCRL